MQVLLLLHLLQSSNIMFGQKFLLKLFRRLDLGVNPDFEIGRFLTERTGFTHVPRTLGALENRRPRYEATSLEKA